MYSKLKFLVVVCLVLTFTHLKAQNARHEQIADTIEIACKPFNTSKLPAKVSIDKNLGIATLPWVQGQVIHKSMPDSNQYLYETRATITPKGDYLMMFPLGLHYGSSAEKVNDLIAYRSKDKGKTWEGPKVAFDIEYSQHGFIPFIPKGSNRIYAFGTQPIKEYHPMERGLNENTAIGYRYSDDDGYTWSEVRIIRPKNDPEFRGMSVMRMCETDKGTWILGSHEGDWSYKPLITRQYFLRSEDKGKTWTVGPDARHKGWFVPCFGRMDEGRPITTSDGGAMFLFRTPEGHYWASWSKDDGKTWTEPKATSLVQPDAPPMLFKLTDGKTMIAIHHNRSTVKTADLGGNMKQHLDRSEIWYSLSKDDGKTWSETRFIFANALAPTLKNIWLSYNCSYIDCFADNGTLHLFVPHRWSRVLHLTISESDLGKFPTKESLLK
jgi:hypothetical protein